MKRINIIILSIFAIVLLCWNVLFAGNGKLVSVDVPLPTDVKIVTPSGEFPKEISALSGVWEGRCFRSMGDYPVALIVEEVNLETARVIFSSGKIEGGTLIIPSRVQRLSAKVISDKNRLQFQDGSQNYMFTMDIDLKHMKGTVAW